ncbi:DUF1990 family protein [Frankia sp. QA3]|uniref:DUF1990 family protein n=1 Tax=Frankia sp. QA3 TaxID=710111 RepID=UPI001E3A8540|nr:DUF1990 family protein [Frankia sp. QA3]
MVGARVGPLPGAELTYPERGATTGSLPAGYRHVRRRVLLGHGQPVLETAAAVVMSWRMHRHAGLRPVATAPGADAGATVVMCAGWGRVGVLAACRSAARPSTATCALGRLARRD